MTSSSTPQPANATDSEYEHEYRLDVVDEDAVTPSVASKHEAKMWKDAIAGAKLASDSPDKPRPDDDDPVDSKTSAVRYEKLFSISNNDATTLTMLFRMSEMRASLSKLLNPTELALYAGMLSGLCGTIALLESQNKGMVRTYQPTIFTFRGLTTNSIVAELGYRMQDFGIAVYHNAAHLLNRQLLDTFGVCDLEFKGHIERHLKTDTNTTWEIFKLNSAQFGALCASYCDDKSIAGAYIRRCWTRGYVVESEMTKTCKDIANRMRPDHVAHMGLLCGAMSDLIELLVNIEAKIRLKKGTPGCVFDENDVRSSARAFKCMLAAREKFMKIYGENERLMVTELCRISRSIRNYITAKYYQATGDAKTALYFITRMDPAEWFIDDQHDIHRIAATVENAKVLSEVKSQKSVPDTYRLEFPDDAIATSSRFYDVVKELDIQWPYFHLTLTQQTMLTPTTLADAMKSTAAMATAAAAATPFAK